MGVYIAGMEIPVFEHQSWDIRHGVDGKWYVVDTNAETSDGEWHELVPVPPHGRLGDLDAALKKLNRICLPDDLSYTIGHDIAKQFLKDAPTIIPADPPIQHVRNTDEFGKAEQLGRRSKRTCENCKYSELMVGALACMGQKGMPFVRPTDSCERWKTMKQTNADRIRAMTDEELAEFEMEDGDCPPERMYPDSCPDCDRVTPKVCRDCWLDWLRKEGEE